MKTKEKIHKYLQEKALNKAINQLIGDIGEHYIDDKKLLFRVKDEKIELLEKLDMPKSFKEYGIDEAIYMSKIDDLANKAFEDQCTTANPRLPLVSELKKILIDAYYGVNM